MRSAIAGAEHANGSSRAAEVFAASVRIFQVDIPVLEGLTWRRVGYTFLVAAAFAFYSAASRWLYLRYGANPQPVGIAPFFLMDRWGWVSSFRAYACVFVSQMLALTVADNLRIARVPRTAVLTVALLIGTAAGSLVVVLGRSGSVLMTSGARFSFVMTWGLLYGASMALIYFKRRRDTELAVALHDAQVRRVELQKKTLESHLQVLQAQIEPQFLFNTLRRVGELYENDSAWANQMLENLIVYLRAALPQMRTSTSTLGQEVQLAQAYLNIERIRAGDRLDFAFDIPDSLASAAFPPMVLLPLIDALALRGRNPAGGDKALRLVARPDAGILKLTLTDTGFAGAVAGDIECVRDRLTTLYGAKGKLELVRLAPQGVLASLEVPHVAT